MHIYPIFTNGDKNMNVAYVRVSSADQNEARQKEALEKYGIEKWFCEKVSGKNMQDRAKLLEMLDWIREGDTVYIMDFSRLARSTKDLLTITDMIEKKKAHLVSMKENLDTSTPTGKLMLTMIAAINEFERANILERQAEGIAIAKRNGVYKGRKKVEVSNFEQYYNRYMSREISKTDIAKELRISRPTVDRLIEEYRAGERSGKKKDTEESPVSEGRREYATAEMLSKRYGIETVTVKLKSGLTKKALKELPEGWEPVPEILSTTRPATYLAKNPKTSGMDRETALIIKQR